MCGIAGIVGISEVNSIQNRIEEMLSPLEHRGPDDKGVEVWNDTILGHRRLSVFDLSSAGHQPMISSSRDVGVVFNGAIYNFRKLRAELETKGHVFHSQTDTEVLLNGYKEWGIDDLVSKIEGMFAFGLWDNAQRKLFLVKDRLGIKPLVYSFEKGVLAFASSVRSLKNAGFCGELDPNGVAEYFEFGFITDEHSIYQGVKKVLPGHIVEWNGGNLSTRQYWKSPEKINFNISFSEAVEETERLFLEAVEKRLQADVPIGALLSGGIDSSLACWAISKLGGDVTAFTVRVLDDDFDESDVAIRTAKQFGIKHQILQIAETQVLDLNDFFTAFGEPFGAASALAMLGISKEVSKEATVLMTGEGGDDIFLGYPEHRDFFLAEKFAENTPKFLGSAMHRVSSLMPKTGTLKRANSFLSYTVGGLGAITQSRDGFPVYMKNDLFGDRMREIKLSHREIPFTSGDNLLSDFLKYDRKTRFVGEYLTKVDSATMFHAIEARSPFLDTKLWEFAESLPLSIRLHNGNLKAVLREIVKKRISPELSNRKKQGFVVPVQRWLTGKWKQPFLDMMQDSILEKEGWIKTKNIEKMLDEAKKQNWAPRQLWFILVFEAWLRFEKR